MFDVRILWAMLAVASAEAIFSARCSAVNFVSHQKEGVLRGSTSSPMIKSICMTRAGSLTHEGSMLGIKTQLVQQVWRFCRQVKRLATIRITIADDNEREVEYPRVGAVQNNDDNFWSSFDRDNALALAEVLRLDQSPDGWQLVSEKDGVTVHKQALAAGPFVSEHDATRGHKHACVKSTAVLDVSPEKVFHLFADNHRVRDYNEHCATVRDIQTLPEVTIEEDDHSSDSNTQSSSTDTLPGRLWRRWSKISYAITPTYRPFKSRDFLSVVHYNQYRNGTAVIVNRPAYLAAHGPSEEHVRATVLLAGNILRPYGEHGNRTQVTMLAQVNPGGGADTPAAAWLINKLCAVGPPQFMRRLEVAAQKGETFLTTSPSNRDTSPVIVDSPTPSTLSLSVSVSTPPGFDVMSETKQALRATVSAATSNIHHVAEQLKLHQTVQQLRTHGQSWLRQQESHRPAVEALQRQCAASARVHANRLSHSAGVWTNALATRMEKEMNCRHHPRVPAGVSRPAASVMSGSMLRRADEEAHGSWQVDREVVGSDAEHKP